MIVVAGMPRAEMGPQPPSVVIAELQLVRGDPEQMQHAQIAQSGEASLISR